MQQIEILQQPPLPNEFMSNYVLKNAPVLIRGAQREAGWGKAVSGDEGSGLEFFSSRSLFDKFGANVVRVSVSESGRWVRVRIVRPMQHNSLAFSVYACEQP